MAATQTSLVLQQELKEINLFKLNGISHRYKLDQLISYSRDVGWYFSFLFKFLRDTTIESKW